MTLHRATAEGFSEIAGASSTWIAPVIGFVRNDPTDATPWVFDVPGVSRDNVDVQVWNCLTCCITRVYADVIAICLIALRDNMLYV
jgi:hypothetical protein